MTIDDCFVIHDIKIIDGPEGIFVAMPSKKNGRGEYKDIAHPINTETRNEIVTTILDAYKLEEAKATHWFTSSLAKHQHFQSIYN